MGTKGVWHRPKYISDYEFDLRWRIKDTPYPDKQGLIDELEALERSEQHWNDYKKQQGVYKHENTSD